MTEGYYPIHEYCNLAGVNRDTAYHRAIRKEVPSFKDEDGRLFIYYANYDINIPEGFVTLREYAKKHNTKPGIVGQYIRLGNFKPSDVFVLAKDIFTPTGCHIFIHKDAELCKKIDLRCPEGYLSAMDWCAKYNISRSNLGQRILKGKIHPVKVGRYIYLEDREY